MPLIGFLFVLNGLLYNIKTPQGMLVISAGLFKETRVQTTIQGLIAVVAEVVMAQFWGLAGILIGAILSNLYRDIDLLFFIPRNVTRLPVRNTFYRIVRIFICCTIIIFPFKYITIHTVSYLEWTKTAILVSLYAALVVLLINVILDRKIFLSVMKRFWVIFAKK